MAGNVVSAARTDNIEIGLPVPPVPPAPVLPVITRIISALVLAPVVLASVYFGGVWFLGLVVACVLVALMEWAKLCASGSVGRAERWAWRIPGGVYIAVSCFSLVLLRGDDLVGRNMVFFVLATVWVADSGAYFCGSLIGGPKLAPRVSPKKTWSGLIGALVMAGITGGVFFTLFPERTVIELCLAGVVVGGAAQIGDLAESLAKRRFQVKDSGALIPGHGGILDRIDGLMAASLLVGVVSGDISGGMSSWF